MEACDYCGAAEPLDFQVGDYKFCNENCAAEKWAETESKLQEARAGETAALKRVAELRRRLTQHHGEIILEILDECEADPLWLDELRPALTQLAKALNLLPKE